MYKVLSELTWCRPLELQRDISMGQDIINFLSHGTAQMFRHKHEKTERKDNLLWFWPLLENLRLSRRWLWIYSLTWRFDDCVRPKLSLIMLFTYSSSSRPTHMRTMQSMGTFYAIFCCDDIMRYPWKPFTWFFILTRCIEWLQDWILDLLTIHMTRNYKQLQHHR
jgi:hypothetical protein